MKDHVEVGHLTKYDAFRLNRDQVMDLEIWLKIHTNVSNFETVSSKTKGYRMLPSNLKVLAKFGLCTNPSKNLDVYSLARACKSFASARMLGFSLKFPVV